MCSDSDSEESETGSDGEWSGDNDPLSDCKESAKSIRGGVEEKGEYT